VACNSVAAIPLASLAKFTLAANRGQDFYNVSLVDSFKFLVTVTPQGGLGCEMMSCRVNINAQCLGELWFNHGSKSACFALTNHSSVAVVLMAPQTLASPRTILSFLRLGVLRLIVTFMMIKVAFLLVLVVLTSFFFFELDANYLITFCP
ncbi:hypothetical protein HYC85_006773, partial [Camellia sinensis]